MSVVCSGEGGSTNLEKKAKIILEREVQFWFIIFGINYP
nr:hypothetical protein C15C7.3 - Caenorhabditis elegans [Caenorhabditis elegans]